METRMKKSKKKRDLIKKDEEKHKQMIEDILQRCNVIRKIYRGLYPDSRYLSITIVGDTIYLNNEYWGTDSDYPIDVIRGGENDQ